MSSYPDTDIDPSRDCFLFRLSHVYITKVWSAQISRKWLEQVSNGVPLQREYFTTGCECYATGV